MERQTILISNDDGVDAKGLQHLIEIAQKFGDVTVVAPERGMSGKSHAITMESPLYVRRIKETDSLSIYACDGTPADCIKVAMDVLMKKRPTLILSGINHGSNSNLSVIYSGTMGAATEGVSYSIPSIGFSLTTHDVNADFAATRYYVEKVLTDVIEKNTNKDLCLNVNIPPIPLEDIKGIKMCRQTRGYWREDFEKRLTPRNTEYYWLIGEFVNHEPEAEDTDEWALKHNYVAIVPVKIDLTDYKALEEAKSWF